MRALHQRRRQGRILLNRPVLAAMDEFLVGPDSADDLEGFKEHLMSRRPSVRLSSIAASSATSSGCRNGRMLTMLAKRMRLVVRAAAAINRFGDGTGPVGNK